MIHLLHYSKYIISLLFFLFFPFLLFCLLFHFISSLHFIMYLNMSTLIFVLCIIFNPLNKGKNHLKVWFIIIESSSFLFIVYKNSYLCGVTYFKSHNKSPHRKSEKHVMELYFSDKKFKFKKKLLHTYWRNAEHKSNTRINIIRKLARIAMPISALITLTKILCGLEVHTHDRRSTKYCYAYGDTAFHPTTMALMRDRNPQGIQNGS